PETPRTRSVLLRRPSPRRISRAAAGTSSASARNRSSARFAAPSMGFAFKRTNRWPSRTPASSSRLALGCTRTEKLTQPSASRSSSRLLRSALAPLHEAQVVVHLGLLLRIQDVVDPFQQRADVAPKHLPHRAQVERLALDRLGAVLGQLDQPVGLQLRLLDRGLALLARVLLDLFADALGRQQGVLEDLLALAVLVDDAAQERHLLLQSGLLALELLQLFRDQVEVGAYLLRIVAAQPFRERLALDLHRGDLHGRPPGAVSMAW